MTDYQPSAAEVAMINELIGEVLRTVARDDHSLAELWINQMKSADGFYVTAPVEGGWRDVLVDGDRFMQIAAHPTPNRFLVRVVMWGLTREMELQLVDGPPVVEDS